jgi:predicted lipid-binding transport protein (Tim44 family)
VESFDLIFFAAVAGYLIYRLYSVLGQKNKSDGGSLPIQKKPTPKSFVTLGVDQTGGDGGVSLEGVNSEFDPESFLMGARRAFTTIIGAYARGDLEMLNSLLDVVVYKSFEKTIKIREKKEETHLTTIVQIPKVQILESKIRRKIAEVTVEFESHQINIIRTKDGREIDSNPEELNVVRDVWTFSRDMKSTSPNWLLKAVRSSGA